jgi:hypothetical protein
MLKTIIRISFALSLLIAATQSNAQQASQRTFRIVNGSENQNNTRTNAVVNLPVLGFTLDQSGALRPLIGITGAASVGAPLDLGFQVVSAAVPPGHDYILATTTTGSWPMLLQVRDNTITVRSSDTFNPAANPPARSPRPASDCARDNRRQFECFDDSYASDTSSQSISVDRIALSPTGSVAAFFSASAGSIFAYGNLSQSPSLMATFDTRGMSAVTAFGVSDDATTAIFAVSYGDAGSVFIVNPRQAPRLIASIHHASAIQFMRNSSDAVIADDVENRIYAFSNGQVFAIAGPEDGIASPNGIAVSNDKQKVFVGNSASGSITTIGLNGTGTQTTACNCTLSSLQPMSADSVFQLTDFSGSSLLLFDANSAAPRMVFVPAGGQF